MANTDQAFGFVPIGTSDGSDYHAKLRPVQFLAADGVECHIGDMVKLTGTTSADGFIPVVARAAAGDALIGSLVSLEPDLTDESTLSAANFRVASTLRIGKVTFGSDVLYAAQASTTLVAADGEQNADIVVGTGDDITGISGSEIGAVIAAGATGQLRLKHVRNTLDNELGADAQWIVNINENQDDHGTGV